MPKGYPKKKVKIDVTPEQAAAEIIRRDDAKDSLIKFTEYTYPQWETSDHHTEIAAKLEAVERGEIKRLAIFMPPRHGKTELSARRFPAWYLGRHPRNQIISVTYNSELAYDTGVDVRSVIDDYLCKNVFPDLHLVEDLTAKDRWRTVEGGVYVARGVGGDITGRGAHIGLIDDPFKGREDADSLRMRNKIWKWYLSTFQTRLMPGGAVVIIMTRWHEDDLAGRALNHENFDVLEIPAIIDEGKPTERTPWPAWFPLEDEKDDNGVIVKQGMKTKRDLLIKAGEIREWYALYQQQPRPDEGVEFKREWFKERAKQPFPEIRYIGTDFAVTAKQEGKEPDLTSFVVLGIDEEDNIIAIDRWAGQVTSDVWTKKLVQLTRKHRPKVIFGEKGVIKNAVEPQLKKAFKKAKIFTRWEWVPRITDKTAHASAFIGAASMGSFLLPETKWAEEVIEQCIAFGSGGNEHDDDIDAIANFFQGIGKVQKSKKNKPEKKAPRPDPWADADNFEKIRAWRVA